jgi:hypothetical protein
VKRETATGDVLIPDVPMVDQGQKGYCVVACAERLMRYYGLPTDANELAQVANSDGTRGTNPDEMLAAVKKLGNRLRVRVRQLDAMEVKEFLALIAEYNRAAKKSGARHVSTAGMMLDVQRIFSSMDAAVLRAVRTKSKGDQEKFKREIQQRVDAGIPVLWSVILGLFPEPGVPQEGGGHTRLIIGYNWKTEEVIFTDSWGAGHERKRMALADAMTITLGLSTIEPL